MHHPKILILDTTPVRRGAQVFAEELAFSLGTIGYEVRRIYLYLSDSETSVSLDSHDRVLNFEASNGFETFPSFHPEILKELDGEIRDFQPQIILCNGSRTLKYGAWLKALGKSAGATLVGRFIDDAGYWNNHVFKRLVYSFWIKQFDGMVAVSQSSLDSMIRHYRFTKPSTVIHRVFDPSKFENAPTRNEARRQLGLEEDDEVLLFLGNLTAQKRPDRFLEVVTQLIKTRQNLKVLIVGDGPLRKGLENQVAIENQAPKIKKQEEQYNSKESNILPLMACVFFTGYQSDVAPFLTASDLLILTSDTEGLPGVVLEAAYFGVPTLATDVGGIRECLIDRETGFLIPDRSVSHFCEKINLLLDHPQERVSMGQRAKSYVSEHFRMDQVVGQYLNFFGQLSRSRG